MIETKRSNFFSVLSRHSKAVASREIFASLAQGGRFYWSQNLYLVVTLRLDEPIALLDFLIEVSFHPPAVVPLTGATDLIFDVGIIIRDDFNFMFHA